MRGRKTLYQIKVSKAETKMPLILSFLSADTCWEAIYKLEKLGFKVDVNDGYSIETNADHAVGTAKLFF